MNGELLHIAQRVFNTPLLIHPRKAEIIASALADRLRVEPMADVSAALAAGDAMARPAVGAFTRIGGENRGPARTTRDGYSYMEPLYEYRDGLALISIEGSLVNRGRWVGANSGLTSYEGLCAQITAAADDGDVENIILDIDSPGGAAMGCFETVEFIRAAGARKPITAVVNSMADSAAYAIASAAGRIVMTPSGEAGSIGVVMLHLDRSKQMKEAGIATTFIYAGSHKIDGHPFAALPADVRAGFQAEVDHLYSMFVSTVARGRKGMSEDQIRATEAQTYIGVGAIAAGLADATGTLADVAAELASPARSVRVFSKGPAMTTPKDSDAGMTRAEHDSILAGAVDTARAAGRKAERDDMAKAMGDLFKDHPRAQAFTDFLAEGIAPAKAAELAAKHAPQAAAVPALLTEMASAPKVNISADGGKSADALNDYEKGALEAKRLLGVK